MKKLAVVLASFAFVISVMCVLATGSNEELHITLNKIALTEAGYPALSPESDGPVALLEEYGLEAYQAESRYPGRALRLYSLFGETPEFREVIHKYGYQQTIPIISYYFENQSIMFEAKQTVGRKLAEGLTWTKEIYAKVSGSNSPVSTASTPATPLTSAQRAWIALNRINESGNGFMGRFAIDQNGTAKVLPLKTGIAISEEFLLGGIETIERKYLSGSKVTGTDIAWGVVDATTIMVGVGIFSRLAKASSATRLAVRTGKIGTKSLFAKIAVGLPKVISWRILKWGSVVGGAYVAYKYPTVITSALGNLAKAIGCPQWIIQIGGWFLIIFILLAPFGLLWPIFILLLSFVRKIFSKIS